MCLKIKSDDEFLSESFTNSDVDVLILKVAKYLYNDMWNDV